MKYFLAVANEESISKAANKLFISQPSLTRQIQAIEKEVGSSLFIRGKRKMILTEMGHLLKKRAEEIITLYEKAESEWLNPNDELTGDIYLGGAESYGMTIIFDVVKTMTELYPKVKFHIFSGNIADVLERLDKGLIDFGLLIQPADLTKYDYLELPYRDTWGVILTKDHPLANKKEIAPNDLEGIPLIQSEHTLRQNFFKSWYKDVKDINIIASYNLLYNAALMAQNKIGVVLCIDNIINTTGNSNLVFKPLAPKLTAEVDLVWKKYTILSKASQVFLKLLEERIKKQL